MPRSVAVFRNVAFALGLTLALPFVLIALSLPIVLAVRLMLFLTGQD